MRHPLRTFALALALAATPACASLPPGEPRIENPFAAARGVDQQAYALLRTYAAIVEEATDVVRDPSVPAALKRTLAQAERAATPAAETLALAVRAYVAARAELEAAPSDAKSAAFAIAARRLAEAFQAAEGPIGALQTLVRQRR